MANKGFIKLHRSILKWEWFQERNTRDVFIYLLLMANWEDKTWHNIFIPAGSLLTSRRSLCDALNMSDRNVRTALEHLQITGEIEIKPTNKYSIISIANWELYQISESEATNKRPTKRPTNDQQNDQQNDQLKALQLVDLSEDADQQNDQQSDRQTTNKTTTYKNIRNKEYKNYFNSESQNGRNKAFVDYLDQENRNGKH